MPQQDVYSAAKAERTNVMDIHECSVSGVETDSDDDNVSEELANFCANCDCQPKGIQLKKCSEYQISQ